MNFFSYNKVEWPIINEYDEKEDLKVLSKPFLLVFFLLFRSSLIEPVISCCSEREIFFSSFVCAALWFSCTIFFFWFLFCTSAIVRSWQKKRRNKISKCNKICIIFTYGWKKNLCKYWRLFYKMEMIFILFFREEWNLQFRSAWFCIK